jgi:hypothetical protein
MPDDEEEHAPNPEEAAFIEEHADDEGLTDGEIVAIHDSLKHGETPPPDAG